jgi:hypothetical protein
MTLNKLPFSLLLASFAPLREPILPDQDTTPSPPSRQGKANILNTFSLPLACFASLREPILPSPSNYQGMNIKVEGVK